MLLASCSSESAQNDLFQGETFSSQQEAIDDFVAKEELKGHIIMAQTNKDEQLLIAEYNRNEYIIGELLEEEGKYKAISISGVASLRGVSGMGWEFTSTAKNEYSIQFHKEENLASSVHVPERTFYFNVGNGHTLKTSPTVTSDAIVSAKTIK